MIHEVSFGRVKPLVGAMILAALVALALASPAHAAEPLIPDANLNAAIKAELGVMDRDLTLADLESLTTLTSNDGNILDLTGLERAANLTTLDLSFNQVSDLAPLSGLTNLTDLYLAFNQIVDTAPLTPLVGLTGLDLSGNQIRSAGPLSGLVNLTMLDLSTNELVDLAPLGSLGSLTDLYLRDNLITDVGPVASLGNLTALDLGWNQISSIGPLAGLVNLEFVAVDSNLITDITPLAGLVKPQLVDVTRNYLDLTPSSPSSVVIATLEARGAEVWSVPQVAKYKITSSAGPGGSISPHGQSTVIEGDELTYTITPSSMYLVKDVVVDGVSVGAVDSYTFSDIYENHTISVSFEFSAMLAPVVFPDPNLEARVRIALGKQSGAITQYDMRSLQTLSAWGCGIRNLSGLEYATNLWWVELGDNQITDLGPLAGLTRLSGLGLGRNQIADLSPLAGLTQLSDLELYRNQITDLTPLSGLTRLRMLTLTGNKINSAAPVAGLTQLTWLDIDYNQLTDISPLAGLINLRHLGLNNNDIVNLAPLSRMSALTHLFLASNEIRDITPLGGLMALKWVSVDYNHLSLKRGGSTMVTAAAIQARGAAVYVNRQEGHTSIRVSGPSSVKAKRKLTLSGSVSPKMSRGFVSITRMRLVGNTWVKVGTDAKVKVSKGRYKYTMAPKQKGRWRFVAMYSGVAGGTSLYESSKSRIKEVRVR